MNLLRFYKYIAIKEGTLRFSVGTILKFQGKTKGYEKFFIYFQLFKLSLLIPLENRIVKVVP